MVQIKPFHVEEWMDRLETTPGALNIAETCCESISVQELVELSSDKTLVNPLDLQSRRMTYGSIPGSETLRGRIAAIYADAGTETLPSENVIVTQGAIAANFLLLYSLIGPGDHVVCVHPTYQQLYEVPKSLGADVSLWKLQASNGYIPDVSELEKLIRPETKMIIINNPNNPTGSTTPESVLRDIISFAKSKNLIVMADEVYRPLYHSLPSGQKAPPSILSFGYEKTVSTSSMSKAYSLAGIRVGWIASRDKSIVDSILGYRNYTTISVSQLDDSVAAYALSDAVRPNLMERNIQLARKNLEILDQFIKKYSAVCSYVRPTAGTTVMIQFRRQGQVIEDDGGFCHELLEKTGVLVMPGDTCFGDAGEFKGHMRFGYVCATEVLEAGLEKLGQYTEKELL